MNTYSYTIIIPHYNIPDLLVRCLKSIPVREDVQVIVVDDCSAGFSEFMESCEELNRPFLEVYSTVQGGSAGRARNEGLKYAKGKWITFIDADDFFSEQLESVLNVVKDKEEDIVFTMHKSVLCGSPSEPSNRNSYHLEIKRKYLETKDDNLLRYHLDPLWGKFFKRTLIEEHRIRFDETRYSNDVMFSLKTGSMAKAVILLPETVYVLTEREGSLDYIKMKPLSEWVVRFEVTVNAYNYCRQNGLPAESFDPYFHLMDLKGYNPTAFFLQLMQNLMKGRCMLVATVLCRMLRGRLRKVKNKLVKGFGS